MKSKPHFRLHNGWWFVSVVYRDHMRGANGRTIAEAWEWFCKP